MAAYMQQFVTRRHTLRVAPTAAEDVVDVPLAALRLTVFRLHEHGYKGRHFPPYRQTPVYPYRDLFRETVKKTPENGRLPTFLAGF